MRQSNTRSSRTDGTQTGGTILLLGNYRPAVAVARALAADGWRIMLGFEGEDLGADCSSHVDEIWDHPNLEDEPQALIDALAALIDGRPDVTAILPVSEEFMLFLAKHDLVLRDQTRVVSPNRLVVATFSDKLKALDFATECGVSTLPYARVSDYRTLLSSADQIGFPLTIRAFGATARLGLKKALIVHNFAELTEEMPDWPDGHDALLLQRYASGARHNVYFAARDGQIIGALETRISRTDHPEGTGLAVEGMTVESSPALFNSTARLAAAIRYTGIGLTQFIVSDDGKRHCFLELNPRISGSHAVPEMAGLPLTRLALDLAGPNSRSNAPEAEAIETISALREGKSGLKYVWTGGDLLGAKHAFMRSEISASKTALWMLRAVHAAVTAKIRMVWSWRDPLPGLLYLFVFLPRCGKLGALLRRNVAGRKRKRVVDTTQKHPRDQELLGGQGNA